MFEFDLVEYFYTELQHADEDEFVEKYCDYINAKEKLQYLGSPLLSAASSGGDLFASLNGNNGISGLPDWNKLSTRERVQYLLEAGAKSESKIINLNSVFKNFRVECDGTTCGFNVAKPINVILGGESYEIALWLAVYSTYVDLSINSPQSITTCYGEAIGYNYGQRAQFYLLIYEDGLKVNKFEGWYGFDE